MKKRILPILTVLLALTVTGTACSSEEPMMPEPSFGTVKAERPSPGENYYGYANYDFLTTGQIPPGKNDYGTFSEGCDNVENYLSDLIDRCVADTASTDTYTVMIRELYQMYLDVDSRESEGITPLLPAVAAVNDAKTTEELIRAMGMLYQYYGVCSLFSFTVIPDICETTTNRLNLQMMNTCGNMKENFTKTDAGSDQIGDITELVLTHLGADAAEAKRRAISVVSMVNDIMRSSLDSEYLRDLEKHNNHYTKKELAELLPNCHTDILLSAFGYDTDEIIVFDVDHVRKINEYFTEDNLQTLKDYILTCAMNEYEDSLPPSYVKKSTADAFVNKKEEYTKKFLAGKFSEELGVLYGREICTDAVMKAAQTMLDDIKTSCRELIQDCERLSADGKEKYLKKFDNIVFLVGYNSEYHSPLNLIPAKDGGTLLTNVIAFNSGAKQREIALLSQKADRNTWNMTPTEVNAVYSRSFNNVMIPAAMLTKPMFDSSASVYSNLGSLGYVIAHEICHAFDAEGYCYDENGSYDPSWLSDSDQEAFQSILKLAVDYYQSYHLLNVYTINGNQTLAENMADIGAVQCLAHTTDKKEELIEIFEGAARLWSSLSPVEDLIITLEADEHSPGEARVNAVLSCIDQFYDVYDIKPGDKMYVAPEDRIKVW